MENKYEINKDKREVVVYFNDEIIILKEFTKLDKVFISNTSDTYQCELVILDSIITEEGDNQDKSITKAYARRIGNEQWLMEFNLEDYSIK